MFKKRVFTNFKFRTLTIILISENFPGLIYLISILFVLQFTDSDSSENQESGTDQPRSEVGTHYYY